MFECVYVFAVAYITLPIIWSRRQTLMTSPLQAVEEIQVNNVVMPPVRILRDAELVL